MKLLRLGLLILACLGGLVGSGAAAERPNIIFILADDLGIANLGSYGGDGVKTPNIDSLAREGLRYTRALAVPLCGPSRAAILTGRYAFRTGATNQDRTGLIRPGVRQGEEIFMPSVLKEAGYVTSSIGKWGQLPLGPSEFGFDDHFTTKGSGTYWNTQPRGKTYNVNGTEKKVADGEYIPDSMHRHLCEFLAAHRSSPFYVYYSLEHIHREILPTPDSAPDSKDHYNDNIVYMDKLVGKLIDELNRLELRKNTLIVFMGDNGTAERYAERATVGGRRLSGEKGSMLEGGGLVPLIVNWPEKIQAGKVIGNPIDSTDFFPTFAELAGAKLPANRVIDGRNFAPYLLGKADHPREWAFVQLARMWYVRETDWKLNEKGELFDMRGAPFDERLVKKEAASTEAEAARARLQRALDTLNPAGGILDDGDGTGQHAGRALESQAAPWWWPFQRRQGRTTP